MSLGIALDLKRRAPNSPPNAGNFAVLTWILLCAGLSACATSDIKSPDKLVDAQTLLVLPVHETNEAQLKRHGFYYIYEIVNIDSFDVTHRAEFRLPIKENMVVVDSLPPGNYAVRQFVFKPMGSGDFTYGDNVEERDDRFYLEPGKITIFDKSLNVRLYNKTPGRGMTTTYQFDMEPLDHAQRSGIVSTLGALEYLSHWEISSLQSPLAVAPKKTQPVAVRRDLSGVYIAETSGDSDTFFSDFSGREVILVQSGRVISGSFGESGQFSGRLDGDVIKFDWWGIAPGGVTGVGEWVLNPEGTAMTGTWAHSTRNRTGVWNLRKKETGDANSVPPSVPVIAMPRVSGTYVSENTGTDRHILLSNYSGGIVKLVQTGSEITGTYADSGLISGEIRDGFIRFDWWGVPRQGSGVGRWEILDGGNELKGTWTNHGRHYYGTWNLKKIE